MNTNIVAVFHPFDVQQDIMVYRNGECIRHVCPSLNNVNTTLCALNKEYPADTINFCGNPSFVNKYIKELKTNFSLQNNPTIEIVSYC